MFSFCSVPFGGVFGKSSLRTSLTLNCPPSYGVPAGPVMRAWMSEMSSSLGKTLMSSSVSVWMSIISLATRLSTTGAMFSIDIDAVAYRSALAPLRRKMQREREEKEEKERGGRENGKIDREEGRGAEGAHPTRTRGTHSVAMTRERVERERERRSVWCASGDLRVSNVPLNPNEKAAK